jgi:ribosomal protein L23
VERTLGEDLALRTLIIQRDIQTEKSKRLLRRNLLHENIPMKVKKMGILKNKRMIYLYQILRLNIIIMKKMMCKCLNHMKIHRKMRIMKNLSLL